MSTTETTTAQPATCVANDPGCEPGWPCLACCDAMNVPDVNLVGIGQNDRPFPTGNGSSNGRSSVQPATEKQIAFLRRLVASKLDPDAVGDLDAYVAKTTEGGKRVVSRLIDGLVKLPDFRPAGAPAPAAEFRWTKVDGDWFVRCTIPGMEVPVGETITVTKANGDTADAVVTASLEGKDGWLFRVAKAEQARTDSTLPDVPEGHYAFESTGDNDLTFVRVDRPTEGRWAGRTFVKMIVGGHPDYPVRGAQAAEYLRRIVEAGVDEARTLYGQEIGRCWKCNRHLTDETSRELGIGPDCRSRL